MVYFVVYVCVCGWMVFVWDEVFEGDVLDGVWIFVWCGFVVMCEVLCCGIDVVVCFDFEVYFDYL